jgi:hypothetical protein
MRAPLGVLLAVLTACTMGAAVAQARQFETVMQDDALVLHRPTPVVKRVLARMRWLGVTRLRVTAVWQEIAPNGMSRRRPKHFRANLPRSYPKANWASLDRAVILANAAGLKVMIDIGFFAPLWAARPAPGEIHGIRDVSPREFALFAAAVARRYNGTFRVGGRRLPRVDTFTLWNEPNHPGFMQPQWVGDVPVAADHYRAMVQAAYPLIKIVQPDSRVLIGGLASGGDDTGLERRAVPPLAFLRRLACVDANYQPVRDGACASFKPVPADGLAHHPYDLLHVPSVSPGIPDWATIADLDALQSTVVNLVKGGRLSPGALSIWLTEFGYETNDVVPSKPWTDEEQARLLPWAERIAYQAPLVVSFPQFLLADVETDAARLRARAGSIRRAPGSWQTGLYTEHGKPKPAADAFRLALDPMLVDGRGGVSLDLFGHVRPARGPAVVMVQWRVRRGPWQVLALQPRSGGHHVSDLLTRPDGTFDVVAPLGLARPPGIQVRLLWRAGGRWRHGAPVVPRHAQSLR